MVPAGITSLSLQNLSALPWLLGPHSQKLFNYISCTLFALRVKDNRLVFSIKGIVQKKSMWKSLMTNVNNSLV